MKKIFLWTFLLSLLWCCQNKPLDAKIEKEIPKEIDSTTYELSYSSDTSYSEFINGLKNVQEQIRLNHDTVSDTYSCDINFDEYFNLFDKLSIAENWKMESHYRHFGDAGRSLLLAFEKGDKFGDSIQNELHKSLKNDELDGMQDYYVSEKLFDYQDSVNYMNCIQIKDDKMGYFQFVIFDLIGDNYCTFGHSNYGEMSIITSKEQIKKLIEQKDNFYYKFSSKKVAKNEPDDSSLFKILNSKYSMDIESVLQIDPTPEVTFNKNVASVRIVTLSPWEGFLELTYTVSRTFPHIVEDVKLNTLIEYNCGILF